MLVRPRAAWGALIVTVLALACGGPQEPADEGAECYRDNDCKPGLVCVPAADGARVCSRDVSGLVSTVEGPPPPPDAGTGDTDPPSDDAGTGDTDPPSDDAGTDSDGG